MRNKFFFFFRDRDISGNSTDKKVNKRENWIFVGYKENGCWLICFTS